MSIRDVIHQYASSQPHAPALICPGRAPLTYLRLLEQMDAAASVLNEVGVSPVDRVVAVLPDAAQMASAFLSISPVAAFAPLSSSLSLAEYESNLKNLKPMAIVLEKKEARLAKMAESLGISVLRYIPNPDDELDAFEVETVGEKLNPEISNGAGRTGDDGIALLLYTSGTTSRQKLVPLTHRNICRSVEKIQRGLGLTSDDRCLNLMPLHHVHGLVAGLLASLGAGGSVVCPPVFLAPQFFEWLSEYQPTWYTAVPTIHQAILTRAKVAQKENQGHSLRFLRSSSSALPLPVAHELDTFFGVPVIEAYGMTEAAHQICSNRIDPNDRRPGAVGRVSSDEVAVMGEDHRLLSSGETGEVVIRGENVTSGYLDNEEANSESFSNGWFRTGDLGYIDGEGFLFLTGRIKEIINRGGENISPSEIDQVLLEHPAVNQAVAFAMPDERMGEEVAAAVILKEGESATPNEIMEFASHRLADFKIPRKIKIVDEIPKGATGKVSRTDLAEKLGLIKKSHAKEVTYVEPRNSHEKDLAQLWKEVLNVERVGVEDDFFGLGGDSILAIQVISRIRSKFKKNLPIVAFFQTPTVAGMADFIQKRAEKSLPGDNGGPAESVISLPRRENLEECSLSSSQEGLWFLCQLDPVNPFYNRPAAYRLKGTLDREALKEALSSMVSRHEVLRTIYRNGEQGLTQVIQPPRPVELNEVDLGDQPNPLSIEEVRPYLDEEVRRPFDLSKDVMLRTKLIRLQEEDHILVLTMHHITSDGWSSEILMRELSALYRAFSTKKGGALPELPIQFSDYAVWQQKRMEEARHEEQLSYWKERLAGSPALLELPTDHPRPPQQTFRGTHERFEMSAELSNALRNLGREENVTLFMMMLAAFQTFLYRYTGSEDIVVGSPFANRTMMETEGLIGFFVNNLVFRTDLSGEPTFREVLERVRQVALDTYANHELSFDRLVDALQVERNLSHSPLFQVMFIFENDHSEALDLEGLETQEIGVDTKTSKYDLTLSIKEVGEKIEGNIEYSTELFERSTILRMMQHLELLLRSASEDPDSPISSLTMLAETEEKQLLVDWNETGKTYSTGCIHELFESQAEKTPDAVAVAFEDEEITYRELNRRANQLAHYLRSLGVGPDALVGIHMKRSIEMMVSLFGILKAGGAYVPLDPTYPEDRIAFMAEDAQLSVMLTDADLASNVSGVAHVVCVDQDWATISRERDDNPESGATHENLAYVIYTSGSTGKPKGVMVEHGNAVNFFVGMDDQIPQAEGEGSPGTWLAITSLSFDISVLEVFWTLTRGFKVVLYSDRVGFETVSQSGRAASSQPMDFSFFYFASGESEEGVADKYHLLLEGAKFADQNGFSAVWTPERHFHEFGGLYPNPSVAGAAIAAITENVQIRAGSCVVPLHNPIRVAEEWALVDNLSKGRVGIAVASGWQPNDFVLAPDNYTRRRELMYENVDIIQKLWAGETVSVPGPAGKDVTVQTLPRPIQDSLPIWVTARSPDTFKKAGAKGFNLLTHLLGLTPDQLAEDLKAYRQAWREAGHPGEGHVALMLHTFVGEDLDFIRETVREPMKGYLSSSMGLVASAAESYSLIQETASTRGRSSRELLEAGELSDEDKDALLTHAFERYFEISGLFGTPESCMEMVDKLKAIGVDEIACLIDFGVPSGMVFDHFKYLNRLRKLAEPVDTNYSIPSLVEKHQVTHFQCTPSMAAMLLADESHRSALARIQTMMVGGEALPVAIAEELKEVLPGVLLNMYGPTETTIWSSVYPVDGTDGEMSIGRPIANTEIYILNGQFQPTPIGVAGELFIGGDGVVRGYWGREELTAERFIQNPFSSKPDARMYRTGDLARYRPDGNIEFLGRADFQVKIRGHRIELGEIEALLDQQSGVQTSVVVARGENPDNKRLVAYAIPEKDDLPSIADLRSALREELPDYMIPAQFVFMESFPLTPNGKIDRLSLPAPEAVSDPEEKAFVAPRNEVESRLEEIWKETLGVQRVGIDENFFEVGGNSLLAVRLVALIEKRMGHDIRLATLFKAPTIEELASTIEQDQVPSTDHDSLENLLNLVEGLSDDQIEKKLNN